MVSYEHFSDQELCRVLRADDSDLVRLLVDRLARNVDAASADCGGCREMSCEIDDLESQISGLERDNAVMHSKVESLEEKLEKLQEKSA
jgi:hypothetical protein